MKLLYIFNLYQQSGGENQWVRSEPEMLRARGHEVIVYQRDNNEIQHFSPWKRAALFWQARWSRESYEAVRAIIRRERPEVAHVYNTLALVTPSVYYACHDEGVPVVQTVYNYRLLCPAGTFLRNGRVCEECVQHSLWRSVGYGCYRESRLQTAALAWTLDSHRRRGTWSQIVNRYLVPTEFMRRKLIEGGLPTEKIVVKPNYHEPDPGLRQLSDGSVLYVGRLSVEKGVRTLLAAWQMLEDAPLLRIVGDGPLRAELETAAARSRGKISVLGSLPHEEVIAHLKKAATLILPSEWYEAFPHVILEAYACGVPIVASRLGTLSDVIKDGVTGVLFEPGNAADLAAKGTRLLRDGAASSRIAVAGRAEYETNYTGDRNYERLMRVYREVAGPSLELQFQRAKGAAVEQHSSESAATAPSAR
jgi:glycosyltransferase involved in cell wall biosynthesis